MLLLLLWMLTLRRMLACICVVRPRLRLWSARWDISPPLLTMQIVPLRDKLLSPWAW